MILRRFRRQAAEHNWFAALIDLLIVVIGVFLGLQVSEWSQARGERAQSHEDRQRLIADLASNEADGDNRARYFRAVQGHAVATLAALDRPVEDSGEAFLIDAYQATQAAPREFKHTTYDEIVATGRLTRLGDPTVRDQIGSLYSGLAASRPLFDFASAYREQLRRVMPNAIQVAIRQHCSERFSFLANGTPILTLPERCAPGLDPGRVAATVRAVRTIPNVRDELNRVIADNDSKLFALHMFVRQIRAVRTRLVAADRAS